LALTLAARAQIWSPVITHLSSPVAVFDLLVLVGFRLPEISNQLARQVAVVGVFFIPGMARQGGDSTPSGCVLAGAGSSREVSKRRL